MIYYCIIVVLFIIGTLNLFKDDKIASLGYVFVILPLIVFVGGLRYEVGTDWYNYSVIFESNNVFTIDNPIEPLFSGLILISKFISNSYSLFIFLLFTISFLIKLNVFLKYSSYFVISVMLYIPVLFLVYDLNGLRQGIAIGITLASLGAIAERKIGRYLFLNIIAIGFHYSAIIFLPFYFFAHINLKKITLSICVLGSIAIGFLTQSLIQNFVSSNLGGAESVFAEKVFSYAGSESYGMALVFNFSSIHRLVIFFIFLFFYEKIKVSEPYKRILLNGYFISVVLYFLFSAIEIVATRGTLYYRCLDVLIIPSFITIPTKKIHRLLVFILVSLYVSLQIYTTLKIPDNSLDPYKNVLIEFIKHD